MDHFRASRTLWATAVAPRNSRPREFLAARSGSWLERPRPHLVKSTTTARAWASSFRKNPQMVASPGNWGGYFFIMTLNDILAGLPGTIVNRFSASNSAFWLAKCSDILSDLDTLCPGPWMIEDVKALPMASGFFRTPPSVSRIKDVRIVDAEYKTIAYGDRAIKRINSLGFDVDERCSDLISTSSFQSLVTGDSEETVSMFPSGTQGTVGDVESSNSLLLWLWLPDDGITTYQRYNGKYVTAIHADGTLSTQAVWNTSWEKNESGKQYWYFVFSSEFPGCAIGDRVVITDEDPSGFLSPGDYGIISGIDYSEIKITSEHSIIGTFDRHKPGRAFPSIISTVFKSNVIVSGYVKTPKPLTLTESLLVPSEWDHLIQAGLRWKAEIDMSPASSDAIVCGKLYSNAVKEYRSKMTMGQGNVHKPYFQGANLHMDTF